MADDAGDSVLRSLVKHAEQGATVSMTLQIGGQFLTGTLISAAEYRIALGERLQVNFAEVEPTDDAYLHLVITNHPHASHGTLYRCAMSAVQGYLVFGV